MLYIKVELSSWHEKEQHKENGFLKKNLYQKTLTEDVVTLPWRHIRNASPATTTKRHHEPSTIAQISRDRQVVSRQLFRELSIYYISDGLSVYFGLLPRIILVIPCYSSRCYFIRGVSSLLVQRNIVVVRSARGSCGIPFWFDYKIFIH